MISRNGGTDRKRVVVTGREGQVVSSLLERSLNHARFQLIPLGRPGLDLSAPETIESALRRSEPDIIVSAAAYTAVDLAENDVRLAQIVNGVSPGKIAETAAALGIPVIHLSTDYVFDGSKSSPYVESDPVAPLGVYGRSKLAGERAVSSATSNYAILRTAWVYSPFGKNFLRTMLRVAGTQDSLNVVEDQIGNPTSALDIADAVLSVAENLLTSDSQELRGTFHLTGTGDASWADFAAEIFALSALEGGPSAEVNRIPSSAYATPAQRPANSRLDCTLLQTRHGVILPDWRQSTATIVKRLAQA